MKNCFLLIVLLLLVSCNHSILVPNYNVVKKEVGVLIMVDNQNQVHNDYFLPSKKGTAINFKDLFVDNNLKQGFVVQIASDRKFSLLKTYSQVFNNENTKYGVETFYVLPVTLEYIDYTSELYNVNEVKNDKTELVYEVDGKNLAFTFDQRSTRIIRISPIKANE